MRQTFQAQEMDTVAADHEASPEDGAEVDVELGQGQITFSFGEICCAYLGGDTIKARALESLSADQSALEDKTPETYSPMGTVA